MSLIYLGKEIYDWLNNCKKTKQYHNETETNLNQAFLSFEATNQKLQNAFGELGRLQTHILQSNLKKYEKLAEKLVGINDLDLQGMSGTEIMDLKNLDKSIVAINEIIVGLIASGVSGAMAGFGAFGAAGMFATASTGTSISTLSGAAATKATLAWFGGGSIASGGLGMAGGMWVLGGIAAIPAVATLIMILGKNAESAKYKALAQWCSTKALIEEIKAEILAKQQVINKAQEKTKDLFKSSDLLMKQIGIVEYISKTQGKSVSKWEAKEQDNLKSMMQLADTIVKTINAPLMNDEDPLTQKIIAHQAKCKELIEKINAKWGK